MQGDPGLVLGLVLLASLVVGAAAALLVTALGLFFVTLAYVGILTAQPFSIHLNVPELLLAAIMLQIGYVAAGWVRTRRSPS